jgi:hypothetical protein
MPDAMGVAGPRGLTYGCCIAGSIDILDPDGLGIEGA